jgi:hypothetical protein
LDLLQPLGRGRGRNEKRPGTFRSPGSEWLMSIGRGRSMSRDGLLSRERPVPGGRQHHVSVALRGPERVAGRYVDKVREMRDALRTRGAVERRDGPRAGPP